MEGAGRWGKAGVPPAAIIPKRGARPSLLPLHTCTSVRNDTHPRWDEYEGVGRCTCSQGLERRTKACCSGRAGFGVRATRGESVQKLAPEGDTLVWRRGPKQGQL